MPFKQFKIHNIGWFWRTTMMDQTQATVTPVINDRKGVEAFAVNALMATYFGLFILYLWNQQFRMPYINTELLSFYWEVIKIDPFSEAAVQYIKLFLNEISRLKIFYWIIFIMLPIISTILFFIARFLLKQMPMHEAAEGGKLSVLGRTLALFIEGKAQLLIVFCIGYSFFATSAFANYVIDLFTQRASFNLFDIFLAFMSFVLAWLFIRPFVAFYVITIHKK
ncbi:hypothetical protein CW745_00815 [Psychromonas sp. psych-6C06]|uniref:hypothetical protein n=1 Tax=Psychromonas sp. psych-6C06 TaxID=2058089 RepID=UPI000C3206ED|nr:hypothetical protein [Psychromonas sp. psych-6C06]PKF63422.1 hypothetical protein CW745_00815 [Psychromonas sp. psych-6C06]